MSCWNFRTSDPTYKLYHTLITFNFPCTLDLLTRVTCSFPEPGQHLYQPCYSGARSRSSLRRRQPTFRANFIPAPVLRWHRDQAYRAIDARVEGTVFIERTLRRHNQLGQPCEDGEDFRPLDFTDVYQARIRENGWVWIWKERYWPSFWFVLFCCFTFWETKLAIFPEFVFRVLRLILQSWTKSVENSANFYLPPGKHRLERSKPSLLPHCNKSAYTTLPPPPLLDDPLKAWR